MEFKDCEINVSGEAVTVQNSRIERKWTVKNGMLHPVSIRNPGSGREFLSGESPVPAPSPDFETTGKCLGTQHETYVARESVVSEEALYLKMRSNFGGYSLLVHIRIFPETPAVSQWIEIEGEIPGDRENAVYKAEVENIEDLRSLAGNARNLTGLNDMLCLDMVHKKLGKADFTAHTDRKDNLCHTTEDLLTIHSVYSYRSNLFYYHDQIENDGLVFLKEAPLPNARSVKNPFDLLSDGGDMYFAGHGTDDPTTYPGYPFTIVIYEDGEFGRTRELHNYQRKFRIYDEKRDDVIWHSTWGDRNADKIVSEKFMLAEIEEMRKIGGDFLYFSDGWQKGAAMTPLSKERYTGQWGKPGYWETDRDKFPDGLGPVVRKADGYGMKKGIWFCPDKTDEYENYEKDIGVLLNLYREYGFDKVKFDAITFRTKRAEKRIKKVMEALVEESEGKAFVEIDITAGIRTDYFDAMQYGFLFLENRYTDFRRYYPHCTLRNLWMLSHYVDPRRLRIELLNNERNSHLYENDPLAPDKYKADFLYVGTIFANPLFWFEVTGLSDSYKKLLKETVELCRPVRKELARSFAYPIGEEPDGFTICGFISVNGDCGYAAFFRCAGEEEAIDTEVPLVQGEYHFELMAGSGGDFKAEVNGKMQIGVPEKHSFGLYRYKRLE